jgi:hypothetical protein
MPPRSEPLASRVRSKIVLIRADAAPIRPEHYRLEARGRDLLVWRPIPGNLIRTANCCDGFCAKAADVARWIQETDGRARPA